MPEENDGAVSERLLDIILSSTATPLRTRPVSTMPLRKVVERIKKPGRKIARTDVLECGHRYDNVFGNWTQHHRCMECPPIEERQTIGTLIERLTEDWRAVRLVRREGRYHAEQTRWTDGAVLGLATADTPDEALRALLDLVRMREERP